MGSKGALLQCTKIYSVSRVLDYVQFVLLANKSRNHYAFHAHVLNFIDTIKAM